MASSGEQHSVILLLLLHKCWTEKSRLSLQSDASEECLDKSVTDEEESLFAALLKKKKKKWENKKPSYITG